MAWSRHAPGTTRSLSGLFQPWVVSEPQLVNASSTSDVSGPSLCSSGVCHWRVLIKSDVHKNLPLKQLKDNLGEKCLCPRHFLPLPADTPRRACGPMACHLFRTCCLFRGSRVSQTSGCLGSFSPQGINYFHMVLVLTGAGDTLSKQKTKMQW